MLRGRSHAEIVSDRAVRNPVSTVLAAYMGGMALGNLFSTHPPTEERIARLRAMERKGY